MICLSKKSKKHKKIDSKIYLSSLSSASEQISTISLKSVSVNLVLPIRNKLMIALNNEMVNKYNEVKESNSNPQQQKYKRKDVLIARKIEKLTQKRQLEVASSNFTKELIPQYQFYLAGEIVIDFDIFKEKSDIFKANPANLYKTLDRMTRCKNHIEFETSSTVTMMNNFEIVVATIQRIEHPRAKEMASLLRDYQDKIQRRTKYSTIYQEQQILKEIKIDYAERKDVSFKNAQQILDSITKDQPNSIYFFVIRRKGLNTTDVLKSGYSNSAVRMSGFSLDEFEQSILRDRNVPIKHQNNAWDYVKEKMYSNFHNKNYSNIQRKISLKNGQILTIFVNARTFPLNINLSPDPILLDLNDYMEVILIEPQYSTIDRLFEANKLSTANQQAYQEQSQAFIEKFYTQKELKSMGFTKKHQKLQKKKISSQSDNSIEKRIGETRNETQKEIRNEKDSRKDICNVSQEQSYCQISEGQENTQMHYHNQLKYEQSMNSEKQQHWVHKNSQSCTDDLLINSDVYSNLQDSKSKDESSLLFIRQDLCNQMESYLSNQHSNQNQITDQHQSYCEGKYQQYYDQSHQMEQEEEQQQQVFSIFQNSEKHHYDENNQYSNDHFQKQNNNYFGSYNGEILQNYNQDTNIQQVYPSLG